MLRPDLIRQFKRRFSIAAPRLAVRPHVPWYVRWAIILPFVLAAGGLVWWAYDVGLELAGFHRGQAARELAELRGQLAGLKDENAKLVRQAAEYERQAQIDRAANMETAKQLQSLTQENSGLQDDLAFFQNLTVPGKHEGELSIHRFKLERDTLPGEYHYRLLLVRNGQMGAQVFQGSLQLLVNVRREGKQSVLLFPENPEDDAASRLNFKYYQHIERSIRLPPDVAVVSAQVRIYGRGESEPRIRQEVSLSQI